MQNSHTANAKMASRLCRILKPAFSAVFKKGNLFAWVLFSFYRVLRSFVDKAFTCSYKGRRGGNIENMTFIDPVLQCTS